MLCSGSGGKGPGQGLIVWAEAAAPSGKSGGYTGGVESILEHIISMLEVSPRYKFQITRIPWMAVSVVDCSRYLAKGKNRTETQQAFSLTLDT